MMRFKLDENLHADLADFFRRHGYDAVTVWDEGLRSRSDTDIIVRCQSEGRASLTMDLGFADIRIYPPEGYPGLIVLRLENQSRNHVLEFATMVLAFLEIEPLAGRLWIVYESTVRLRGG
jgi:predicted nuclease of predicted toxin-antitoxin system